MAKLMGFALGACLALAAVAPASAMPLTWTLSGVVFEDGGTASGSFVYDADTNTYGTISVTTTAGTLFGGATYTLPDPGVNPIYYAGDAVFVTGPAADYTGLPVISLVPPGVYTDAGGTLPIDGSAEFTCTTANCDFGIKVRYITAGFVSASSVPEPLTLSLFAGGLAATTALRRRRRKA